jgi:hypothetical protein
MPRILDPLELLTQQHDDIVTRLDALAMTDEPDRTRALNDLADRLTDHLAAEQALLYPIVGDRIAKAVRDELVAEHVEIKRVLADVLWFGLDDAETSYRIAALRALLEGHTSYQEHDLFELAAETLAPVDITVLGNRLQAWFVMSVAHAA